jgi:hypothetical protein
VPGDDQLCGIDLELFVQRLAQVITDGRATHRGHKSSGAARAVIFDINGKVCESACSETKQ